MSRIKYLLGLLVVLVAVFALTAAPASAATSDQHRVKAAEIAHLHCMNTGYPCVSDGVETIYFMPGWAGIISEARIQWRYNVNGNNLTCRRYIYVMNISPPFNWQNSPKTDFYVPVAYQEACSWLG